MSIENLKTFGTSRALEEIPPDCGTAHSARFALPQAVEASPELATAWAANSRSVIAPPARTPSIDSRC